MDKPTANDRPDQSCGVSGNPSENIKEGSAPTPHVPLSQCGPAPRPCGLAFGYQQHRIGQTRAGPAHEFRIGESISGSTSTVKPVKSGDTASQMLRQASGLGQADQSLSRLTSCLFLVTVKCPDTSWRRTSRVFGLELLGVALVQDQAVVVIQFLTGCNVTQCLDEDAPVHLVGLTVAVARVVDPARRVSTDLGVNHMVFVDVKIERVVGSFGSCGWRAWLLPSDDFAHILDDGFALAISCSANTPLP